MRGSEAFVVTVDSESISLPLNATIIDAFDILFKVFFVMNVEFPKSLKFFYDFLETQVYETSTNVPYPSVVTFSNALRDYVERSESEDE